MTTLVLPLAVLAVGSGVASLNDLPSEAKTLLSSLSASGVQFLRLGMTNQRASGRALLPGDGFQVALAGVGAWVAISVLHTLPWFDSSPLELQLSAGMTTGWLGAEAGFALGKRLFGIGGVTDAKKPD